MKNPQWIVKDPKKLLLFYFTWGFVSLQVHSVAMGLKPQ